MFGELIGLWSAEAWARLGRPARVAWVEVGPGDGTLMADALRAGRAAPDFLAAAELWLVEPSGPLRDLQRERLAGAPCEPRWIGSLEELPGDAPVILVANEVLDCLPARQFVRTDRGWAERRVGLDAVGELAFGLMPCAPPPRRRRAAGGDGRGSPPPRRRSARRSARSWRGGVERGC